MKSPVRSASFWRFVGQRPREQVSLMVLMSAGLLACSQGTAQAQSQPRLPANATPVKAPDWLQRGSAGTYRVDGNRAQVVLQDKASILHWSSLDVGRNVTLDFTLSGPTARVLNKVDGGAFQNKTLIEGALKSNGQVYIYNPHGVVFGRQATVDVNSLVATSLKLDDQRFMDGVLSSPFTPAFSRDATLGLGFVPGAVVVEGSREGGVLQQAALQAQKNGLILLLAPEVLNQGQLSAPDGQVVLAAGSKAYLAGPTQTNLRGLLVEVGSEGLAALAQGPQVTNDVLGQVDVQRGNVTMVGLAVNQLGRVSASTSVNLNGSIYLRAQDGAVAEGAAARATHTGTLVLGGQSVTSVNPTLDDPATSAPPPNGIRFNPSEVDLVGQSVSLQLGARVTAASGNVTVSAKANPSAAAAAPNLSRIDLASGSVIDVSGSRDVLLDMESNVVKAELRGGELADNVLLRQSAVRGQTVYLDARKAPNGIPIANVQGYLALRETNVGEKTAQGGTVVLDSEGSIAQKAGSRIDVSGGSVRYRDGHVNTTKLTLNGALFDIETAPANLRYDGVVRLQDSAANAEAGYTEGRNAGNITFKAPSLSLDAKAQNLGQVVQGDRQRDRGASNAPQGGSLVLGIDDTTSGLALGNTVRLGSAMPPPDATTLQLDVNALMQQGLRDIKVVSKSAVSVDQALALAAGSRLSLSSADAVEVGQSVRGSGAAFSATATQGRVKVAQGVSLDMRGQFQNDLLGVAGHRNPSTGLLDEAFITKGGSVSLSGNVVEVGQGAALDVSGGAWVEASGKVNAGAAGRINLQARAVTDDTRLTLGENVTLSGFGLRAGGTLSLTGRSVYIGQARALEALKADAGNLLLTPQFFEEGGFAQRSIEATRRLEVLPGTVVKPRASSWVLDPRYQRMASSATLTPVARIDLLPLASAYGSRQAASLSLSTSGSPLSGAGFGALVVGRDAAVLADPGATLTLTATDLLFVDGTLRADGGNIALSVTDGDASLPATRLWLGSHARLLAGGSTERTYADAAGALVGDLLDGGRVLLGRGTADSPEPTRGTVVTEAGSVVDVSGVRLDNVALKSGGGLLKGQAIAGAGGTVTVAASEGLFLAGQFRGDAGNAQARQGTLNISLDNLTEVGPRDLRLGTLGADPALTAGASPEAGLGLTSRTAEVSLAALGQGSFGQMAFRSGDRITLADDLTLNAGSRLVLQAPQVVAQSDAGQVSLRAPYISLGNTDIRLQDAPRAMDGSARLTVQAETLDLVGRLATQGFGQVSLQATHDLRLQGAVTSPGTLDNIGAFQTGHQLDLTAAQVYPTSLTRFSLGLTGADTHLRVQGNGQAPGAVLSAGGVLTAQADHIVQAGRLLAPFGRLTLEATQDLVYAPGSLTSVAGSGVVPLGSVSNGTDWTYRLGSDSTVTLKAKPGSNPDVPERALTAKAIVSKAPSVAVSNGAVLDLSGGGKLMALEAIPGPGGSRDVLASTNAAGKPVKFAIIPGFKGSVAPADADIGSGGLQAGDQVYLSGMKGLAAGLYTLLPARYALLPGGYTVEAAVGARDMSLRDNRLNADGSFTVAGQRRSATDGRGDTRWSGFTVSPPELIRQQTEFRLYDADAFFSAQAKAAGVSTPLPRDGGHVGFEVTRALDLSGATRLMSASGGVRGVADVSAPLLEVVSQRSTDTGPYVKLTVADLQALGADSLLLGGRRVDRAEGPLLQVTADVVRIDNDAAHPLTGPEFIVAANDTVQLTSRATVLASSKPQGESQGALRIDGRGAQADGALLRVSGGSAVEVLRDVATGQQGRLDLASGAQVTASGSLYLEATQSMRADAAFALAPGSAVGVHASDIRLGTDLPMGLGGVSFGPSALAAFRGASALSLSSDDRVDFYGRVDLGLPSTTSLSVKARELVSHQADVRLTAQHLTLTGLADAGPARPLATSGSGSLQTSATTIDLGGQSLQLSGFASTRLQADGEVRAQAADAVLRADGDLAIASARLSPGSGVRASFEAGGALTLGTTAALQNLGAAGLGGQLLFSADHIESTANLQALAGLVEFHAQHGLNIASGSIDVRGVSKAFGSGMAHAPAGQIVLDGGTGNVVVGSGAMLDLSSVGASAGTLSVSASGSTASRFMLAGQVRGAATAVAGNEATARPEQGRFVLDVAQAPGMAEFDALNATLNQAGFTQSREVRARQGTLALGRQGLIQAREVLLSVDDGNLAISGTVDARGPAGGSVGLYAAQADARGSRGRVLIDGTAALLASATQDTATAAGSVGDGGRIVLGAANASGAMASGVGGGASVRVATGAVLDVSALGSGQAGSVVVRAPRVGADTEAGSDVAIERFDATVKGAASVQIEAVKTYQATTISGRPDSATNLDAGLNGRMASDAAALMGAQTAVTRRLGRTDVNLTSGVEVRSEGDLQVSVNESSFDRGERGWNLNTWRFGGQAGTLSLRAAGNLEIQGSVSDGFVRSASGSAMPDWALDTRDRSWSLRLAGGADFSAANPLAVRSTPQRGDVTFSFGRAFDADDVPVAVVRTGTGRIDVAAGRDIVQATLTVPNADGDVTMDQHVGTALYTAGRAQALPADFVAPRNARNGEFALGTDPSVAQFGTEGGGVSLLAQRDVIGSAVAQPLNDWLFRQGRTQRDEQGRLVFEQVALPGQPALGLNTAWWSQSAYFNQGVATLGGGDLKVVALRGSVSDLTASVASNAYQGGTLVDAAKFKESGGGDLTVRAGADIRGGQFYAQNGQTRLHADGSLMAGKVGLYDTVDEVLVPLRTVLATGRGSVDVSAGRTLEIEAIYNPTLAPQSTHNVSNVPANTNFDNALPGNASLAQYSNFSTYADTTSVRLLSLGGDVVWSNNVSLLTQAVTLRNGAGVPLGGNSANQGGLAPGLFSLAPPNVQAVAMMGNIGFLQDQVTLAPSATGQLELLAGQSVRIGNGQPQGARLKQLDIDPATFSPVSAPRALVSADTANWLSGAYGGLASHAPVALHTGDPQPVRVVALQGDVQGGSDQAASLITAKKVEVLAGRDVRDLGWVVQQVSATDESVIQAGRDVIDTPKDQTRSDVAHRVGGLGALSVQAGRDVDLANSLGLVSRGNLDNPYLPEAGADLTVVAGALPPAGQPGLNPFEKLTQNRAFFRSLVDAVQRSDLETFDQIIARAFSQGSIGTGNIKVFGSQFRTDQGGDINLFAPGGSIIAGQTDSNLVTYGPSQNGIFTIQGGAIQALVGKNFQVGQGRIFTLGGGDITLVSQFGDIDAGRGAKTASSAPPPQLKVDSNGNVQLDISGSISGSGIATLRTGDKVPPSNVNAVAPRGVFDAGDAGVRSTGTVAIAAAVVLNASNIVASGGVSGAVTVDTGGLASAAAPTSSGSTAQEATKQLTVAPKETMALSVEVLGYGNGEADDATTDDDEDEKRKKRSKRL